jgi:hypothetical protein
LDPAKYYAPKDIFLGEIVAPNAYIITKWCGRDATVPEFLEMMDVPASVIKHASDRNRLTESCSASLLSSPPLKILQEVGYMMFGRDEKKFVNDTLDLPVGAETKYNLRSQLPGMEDIYKDINQAKAAKNDDAATDFALWEEAIMKTPSDWETDWAIVGREHKHDYARKHFDTIRGCMQKRLSASGLNDVLWVPGFWLPSVYNVMDSCTHASLFGDVDIGEMFLNFPLDLRIRAYCGVDLTWIKDSDQTVWECWQRMAMVFLRSSPWVTTRLVAWMVEFVVGDKACPHNSFRWDRVILNLPGDSDYNPAMPRVY